MDLNEREQEVRVAAMHYYNAIGDKGKRMEVLLEATTKYLENGGTTEMLRKIVGSNEREEGG